MDEARDRVRSGSNKPRRASATAPHARRPSPPTSNFTDPRSAGTATRLAFTPRTAPAPSGMCSARASSTAALTRRPRAGGRLDRIPHGAPLRPPGTIHGAGRKPPHPLADHAMALPLSKPTLPTLRTEHGRRLTYTPPRNGLAVARAHSHAWMDRRAVQPPWRASRAPVRQATQCAGRRFGRPRAPPKDQ